MDGRPATNAGQRGRQAVVVRPAGDRPPDRTDTARRAGEPGSPVRRRRSPAVLDAAAGRRRPHHRLPVPADERQRHHLEPGLDRHPGQRGHHQLHGRQPHQRDRLHLRGAGAQSRRRRAAVEPGDRYAERTPDAGRAGGAARRRRVRPAHAGLDRAGVPWRRRHALPLPAQDQRRHHLEPGLDRHPGQRRRHHQLHGRQPGRRHHLQPGSAGGEQRGQRYGGRHQRHAVRRPGAGDRVVRGGERTGARRAGAGRR